MDLDPGTGSGPLAGVRVAEISGVVMAPMAGRLLAKLGATVVKVEPPHGDVVRNIGARVAPGMSGAAHSLGDGKYNIAIDMSTEEGLAELRVILGSADIIVTNHLPSRRRRFGLDWESVRAINPRAILCTAQGHASDSTMADTPAYDDTVQAASGVCDIYSKSEGRPRYAPYVMADKICALTIVYSVLAALHHRNTHGRGQWVDVPMVDVMVDFNLAEQLNEFSFIPPRGPAGWHRTLAPSRRPHRCVDGWVCVLPYSDRNWGDFLRIAGVDCEAGNVPFATNQERNDNMEDVQAIISGYAAERTTREILRECGSVGVPVQQVRTLESLVEDDYLRERGTVQEIRHPLGHSYFRTTPNISFTDSPLRPVRPATSVDADREEVTRRW
ncbi:MAG TPA: CoA transferase [Nocardiopsis listeri]|uniref:CaiB/BaiF CoA transferase family protein n=1 Tax=Nocardiopsis listeri TaxID=53440 RepID=UPI001DFA6E0C|nr:CoA transferase [Nocardiopsis listeri]HJE59454.1 CoA transferase [Nocardiopsis listeri]